MDKNWVLTGRRNFLLGLGAFTVTGGLKNLNYQRQARGQRRRDFTIRRNLPLRYQAAAKGLIYGAAGRQDRLSSDAQYAAYFAQECGILVPDWELKWKALRPTPDTFDFSKGDWLIEFAHIHRMYFRGHTLVWHNDLPQWFASTVNKQNAQQILLQHIATVVKRYAGRTHSWDVVNEAVLPQDNRSDGLRNTPWLELLGPDYIEMAFRAAAEADPRALLVYNDYRLDYDSSDEEAKRTAVLRLLERLKSRGTPVHALGMQAHLHGDEHGNFNPQTLKAFLRNVASLGLKILITEMDVADQKLPLDVNVRDRMVAGIYQDYLTVALEEPAVIAILTWGLSDRYTWLSQEKPRPDGAPVRPLPLDAQLNRKWTWNAIARAFEQAPKFNRAYS